MRTRRRPSLPTALGKSFGPLQNAFPAFEPFSNDYIATLHQTALNLLKDQGIRILYPEARDLLAKAGAAIRGDLVFFGPELVEQALQTAPKVYTLKGAHPSKDLPIHPSSLLIQPGAGAPNAHDQERGRRPGRLQDFRELIQLTEAFDILHTAPPLVEPQDVAPAIRHLVTTQIALEHSTKPPAIYARGRAQVQDCFEMIQNFRGLSDAAFAAHPHVYTIINTNSPRQIDTPMAQGLIDFARAGQLSVITPFTLMGAMAPITVAGALALSHAEALAALTLAQIARPGAPVMYGTFTSNVHMKSGAPAFGTPEHFQASVGAGQLARHINLPWRSATGTSANINDAQAAAETQLGLWGCLMGGANAILHGAGWLEGGLCLSYEKFITDVEVLAMMATLCQPLEATPETLGLQALQDVPPGGHFFESEHTLDRYRTAFYEPLVHQTTNIETWQERGEQDANARATQIWQGILTHPKTPNHNPDKRGELQNFIQRRCREGGAEPLA